MIPIFPFEEQALFFIQAHSSAFLDIFFKVAGLLGHPAIWIFVASLLYWSYRERESFFLVNVIVFACAASAVLKVVFARPRPDQLVHRVLPLDPVSAMFEAHSPPFGLPSGHTTVITAVITFFSKERRALTIVVFSVIALLVALARMYLGAHHLLDVVVGLVLGVAVGLATLWIDKTFKSHNFHLSKLEDEAIVIVIIAVAVFAIALFDVPVLAFSVLGYYAGFFLSKELSFKQAVFSGRKQGLKLLAGTVSAGIMLVMTVALYSVNEPLALACFFGNGFWLTYGYPEFFGKAMKFAAGFPALERVLK